MKKIFEELSNERVNIIEDKISDKWEQENILDKTINNRISTHYCLSIRRIY